MKKNQKVLLAILGLFSAFPAVYAAVAIDLSHQPFSAFANIDSFTSQSNTKALVKNTSLDLREINRHLDFKKMLHVRYQQTFKGYPVWGGEAIAHIPNGAGTPTTTTETLQKGVPQKSTFMTGTFYQGIEKDLENTPNYVFGKEKANQALDFVAGLTRVEKDKITKQKTQLMVYIDDTSKSHWAYQVSFYVSSRSFAPVYVIDAVTFDVYEHWNAVKTMESVLGGGYGGNEKVGKLTYDGLPKDLAALDVTRDATTNKCYLKNKDVTVENYVSERVHPVVSFRCDAMDPIYNNTYWDGAPDSVNGGYSPANDALFNGQVVKRMYQDWYKMDVLTENAQPGGKPLALTMIVHGLICDEYGCTKENAQWDPDTSTMTFGDGGSDFYPLVSLGVTAHEISHGFTEQHSNLFYTRQSGAINESFSDMAVEAAEFYAYGKNTWQIGAEVFKEPGQAMRYMDMPSKDGFSIDDASQYNRSVEVHEGSGVYNRLFYLMGTAPGYDARKAFDVMVQAQNYWTTTATFQSAACGVIQAAKDVGFSVDVVKNALDTVKIHYQTC